MKNNFTNTLCEGFNSKCSSRSPETIGARSVGSSTIATCFRVSRSGAVPYELAIQEGRTLRDFFRNFFRLPIDQGRALLELRFRVFYLAFRDSGIWAIGLQFHIQFQIARIHRRKLYREQHHRDLISGFGCRVSVWGWGLMFQFRFAGFGVTARPTARPSLWEKNIDSGWQVSGFGLRGSSFGCRSSGFGFWVSSFEFRGNLWTLDPYPEPRNPAGSDVPWKHTTGVPRSSETNQKICG